mgnify:CR=1 FL=1
MNKTAIIVLFGLLLTGCSSVLMLGVGKNTAVLNCQQEDYVPRVYSGVFNDIRLLGDTPTNEFFFLQLICHSVLPSIRLPYLIPSLHSFYGATYVVSSIFR